MYYLRLIGLTAALTLGLGSAICTADSHEGFRPIFDGKTLDGWTGMEGVWTVEDGAITGRANTGDFETNTFLIWRQGTLDDFELKLKFRIETGNSGIQFRARDYGDHHVGGYQADIDSANEWTGSLYDENGRQALCATGEKVVFHADGERETEQVNDPEELLADIKAGEWNDYHIIASGSHITIKINGQTTAEIIDNETGKSAASGILAFQLHQGAPQLIQYKDIALKRLPLSGDRKKVVFIAGRPSHGYGAHEHNAGCLLLAKALNESMPNFNAVVYHNGWPSDPTALDNADTVVMFADGGEWHPVNKNLEQTDEAMKRGAGLVCLHYGIEVPKGDSGDAFLDWIGGYFETHWSVNPHWTIENATLAQDHPITRGIKPFTINDEWYYNMRFREDMEGVTPIVIGVPPDETRTTRADGTHSNNPFVRSQAGKSREEIVAWAAERPDGGRGFGFSGAHDHWNWGHDDFRNLVLNAIVWTAQGDVPSDGVQSKALAADEIMANQDEDRVSRRYSKEQTEAKLAEWREARQR